MEMAVFKVSIMADKAVSKEKVKITAEMVSKMDKATMDRTIIKAMVNRIKLLPRQVPLVQFLLLPIIIKAIMAETMEATITMAARMI